MTISVFCRNSNYGTAICTWEFLIIYTQTTTEACLHLHLYSTVCFEPRSGLQKEIYIDQFRDPRGDEGWHCWNRKGMRLSQDLTGGEANVCKCEAVCTQNREGHWFISGSTELFIPFTHRVAPCCKDGREEQGHSLSSFLPHFSPCYSQAIRVPLLGKAPAPPQASIRLSPAQDGENLARKVTCSGSGGSDCAQSDGTGELKSQTRDDPPSSNFCFWTEIPFFFYYFLLWFGLFFLTVKKSSELQ